MPADGGLYVPYECEDLRNWILYADENTSSVELASGADANGDGNIDVYVTWL